MVDASIERAKEKRAIYEGLANNNPALLWIALLTVRNPYLKEGSRNVNDGGYSRSVGMIVSWLSPENNDPWAFSFDEIVVDSKEKGKGEVLAEYLMYFTQKSSVTDVNQKKDLEDKMNMIHRTATRLDHHAVPFGAGIKFVEKVVSKLTTSTSSTLSPQAKR